jgi:hypothetical protein
MDFDKVEQVGKVLLKRIKSSKADKPVYSDGPVEKEVSRGFKPGPHLWDNSLLFQRLVCLDLHFPPSVHLLPVGLQKYFKRIR